jgi:TPR repeat protein
VRAHKPTLSARAERGFVRARVNSTCAGELGSADAWRNLASMYAKGEGTEPSEQTAKYLLELAGSLKKGDLDAMT